MTDTALSISGDDLLQAKGNALVKNLQVSAPGIHATSPLAKIVDRTHNHGSDVPPASCAPDADGRARKH